MADTKFPSPSPESSDDDQEKKDLTGSLPEDSELEPTEETDPEEEEEKKPEKFPAPAAIEPIPDFLSWKRGRTELDFAVTEGLNDTEREVVEAHSDRLRYINFDKLQKLGRGEYQGEATEKEYQNAYNQFASSFRVDAPEGVEFSEEKVQAAIQAATIEVGADATNNRLSLIEGLDDKSIKFLAQQGAEGFDLDNPSRTKITASALNNYSPSDEFQEQALQKGVDNLLSGLREKTLNQVAVRSNLIPFASVPFFEGGEEVGETVDVSPRALKQFDSPSEAVKFSIENGHIKPDQALTAYTLATEKEEDLDLSLAEIVRSQQLSSYVNNSLPTIKNKDPLLNSLRRAANDPDNQEVKEDFYEAFAGSLNSADVEGGGFKIDPEDKSFRALADDYIFQRSSQDLPESFKDEGDLSSNVRKDPLTGQITIHKATIFRPDIFEKSLEDAGLSEEDKETLRARRKVIFNTPSFQYSDGVRNALKFLRNDEGQSFEEYLEVRNESVDTDAFDKYSEELWEKRSEKIRSGEMSREEAQFFFPETEAKSFGDLFDEFLQEAKVDKGVIYGLSMLEEAVLSATEYYAYSVPLLAEQAAALVSPRMAEKIRETKAYKGSEERSVALVKKNMAQREAMETFGYKPGMLFDVAGAASGVGGQIVADILLTRGAGTLGKLSGKVGSKVGSKVGLPTLKGAKELAQMKILSKIADDAALKKINAAKGAARSKAYKEAIAKKLRPGTATRAIPGIMSRTYLAGYSRNYGASLNEIQNSPEGQDMTLDQQREFAADAAGFQTGFEAALTAGFAKGGFDVVESSILRGISPKGLKKYLSKDLGKIDNKKFSALVGTSVKELEKELGVARGKIPTLLLGAVSEGIEEGLPSGASIVFEDFLMSYLDYNELNEDVPILRIFDKYLEFGKYLASGQVDSDLIKEAYETGKYDFLIGAILGGGVSGVRSVGSGLGSMVAPSRDSREAAMQASQLLYEKISDKLSDSGSPLTAEVVANILTSPARGKDFDGRTRAEVEELIAKGELTMEDAVRMGLAQPTPEPSPTPEPVTGTEPTTEAEPTPEAEPSPDPTPEAEPSPDPAPEAEPTPTSEKEVDTPIKITFDRVETDSVKETVEEFFDSDQNSDQQAAADPSTLSSPEVTPDPRLEPLSADEEVDRVVAQVDETVFPKETQAPKDPKVREQAQAVSDEVSRINQSGGKVVFVKDAEEADRVLRKARGGKGIRQDQKAKLSKESSFQANVDGSPVTFVFESKLKNKTTSALRKILKKASRDTQVSKLIGRDSVVLPSNQTVKKLKIKDFDSLTDSEKVSSVLDWLDSDPQNNLDPQSDKEFITYLRKLSGKAQVSATPVTANAVSSVVSSKVGSPIMPPASESPVLNTEQKLESGRTKRVFNKASIEETAKQFKGEDVEAFKIFMSVLEKSLEQLPSTVTLVIGKSRFAASANRRTGEVSIDPVALFEQFKGNRDLDFSNPSHQKYVSASLQRIVVEEFAHIASFNSIPQNVFDEVVNGMSDSDYEYVISTYFKFDKKGAAKARSDLKSGDPETVKRQKEYLVEEFLRQQYQDKEAGFTTEDSYLLLKGEKRKPVRDLVIAYLKGMYRRITKKTRNGRFLSGPERAAVARITDEINTLRMDFNTPLPYGYTFDDSPQGAAADIEALSQMFPPQEPSALGMPQMSEESIPFVDQPKILSNTPVVPGRRVATAPPTATGKRRPFTELERAASGMDVLFSNYRLQRSYVPNATAISQYEILGQAGRDLLEKLNRADDAEKQGVADEIHQALITKITDNLLHLHDEMNPTVRERARLWYEGANRVARDLAATYNISPEQAAAAIAVLSPQNDWFQNVSLASRTLDILYNQGQTVFDKKLMEKYAALESSQQKKSGVSAKQHEIDMENRRKEARLYANKHLLGKKLDDLSDDDAAIFVRAYDQEYNPRGYAVITPEGNRIEPKANKEGTALLSVGWGSYAEISKAVTMYRSDDFVTLSQTVGGAHKVRNFYNNIIDPTNSKDVTIDTHAVAAGLLLPVAGADSEVSHNFGTNNKGDTRRISNEGRAKYGHNGTYAIFAEAYRRAGAARNLKAREMQSITWEQVRTLFEADQKNNNVLVESRELWYDSADDKSARASVEKKFGGYGLPDWATPSRREDGAEALPQQTQDQRAGLADVYGDGLGESRESPSGITLIDPRRTAAEGATTRRSLDDQGAPRISDEDALDDAIYMDSVDRNDYEMAEEALERVAARYGVENPELVVRDKDGDILTPAQRFMIPPTVISPQKIARHKELEAKHDAGTITPEETAEAERIVAEAAKAAGFDSPKVYHGTNEDFDTFSKEKLGSKNIFAESAREGFFLAGSSTTAENYMGLTSLDFAGLSISQDPLLAEARVKFRDELDEVGRKEKEVLGSLDKELLNNPNTKQLTEIFGEAFEENRLRKMNILSEVVFGKPYGTKQGEILEESGVNAMRDEVNARINKFIEQEYLNRSGKTPQIKELFTKMGNPYIIDAGDTVAGAEFPLTNHIQDAKTLGHDGVIFKNISDGGGPDTVYVAFEPNQIKSADPFTGVPIDERFDRDQDSILYSARFLDDIEGGDDISATPEFDIRPLLQTLEMPLVHTRKEFGLFRRIIAKLTGTNLPSQRDIMGDEGGWTAFSKAIINGDFPDERIRNMIIGNGRFVPSVESLLNRLHITMEDIIKKKYKGNLPADVRKDFNTAIGTEDIVVDSVKKGRIDAQHKADIALINSGDPNSYRQMTQEEADTLIQTAREENPTATNQEIGVIAGNLYRKKLFKEAENKQKEATDKLLQESARQEKIKVVQALKRLEDRGENDLVQIVVELRQMISDISNYFGEEGADALNKELKLAFDVSNGFYLSRRYRFFNDPTYKSNLIELIRGGEKVKGSKRKVAELNERIENAIPEFIGIARLEIQKKLLETKLREAQKRGEVISQEKSKQITESKEFQREVDQELGDPETAAKEAMIEYLAEFGDARDYETASNGAKTIHDALKQKKNLTPGIKKLLGQYESDADAITGIRVMLQTIQTQTHMLASIMKLKNLVDLDNRLREDAEAAGEKYNPFILSDDEHRNLNALDKKSYEELEGSIPDSNPLKGKFIRKDIKAALEVSKDPIDMNRANETAKGFARAVSAVGVLNGLTLMGVTTFSGLAFHFRNSISTVFRAIRAGAFLKPAYATKILVRAIAEAAVAFPGVNEKYRYVPDWINRLARGERVSLESLMVEHAKLEGLSVVNQSVRSAVYKDLFGLRKSEPSFIADMDKLESLNPASRAYRKLSKKVLDYSLKLTNASDNAFRIATYYNNVDLLKKARAKGDGSSFRGIPITEMSDYDIEREAARMMNKITPGEDYLVQAGKTLAESPLRVVISSFARFKFETMRTYVNYHTEVGELLNSSNPVMRAEGVKRLAGVIAMYGISFGPTSYLLSKLLGGLEEEEQDALDEGNPSFYKRAQMLRKLNRSTGEITDYNFTYMDEMAFLGDPFSYALQEIRQDKLGPMGAVSGFLGAIAFGEILDQQVLSQVIHEVIYTNRDAKGKKIVEDNDTGEDRIYKPILYALKRLAPAYVRGSVEGKQAFESAQGTYSEKMEAAAKALFNRAVLPTKPFTRPVSERYLSILYKYNRFKRIAGEHKSDAMSENIYVGSTSRRPTDEEVREFVNNYYEGLIQVYDMTDKLTKQFFKMGMSPEEIAVSLSSSGLMSKKDIANYLRGSTRSQLVTRTFSLPLPTSGKAGDEGKLRKFDDVGDANRRYRFMLEARRRYTTEGFEDGTYVPQTYNPTNEDEE